MLKKIALPLLILILRLLLSDDHMKLNKEWHTQHKMPPKATLEQRMQWHLEHSQNCECRPIPEKLKQEMKKTGLLK